MSKPRKSAILKAKREPTSAPYNEPLVYNRQKVAHRVNFCIFAEEEYINVALITKKKQKDLASCSNRLTMRPMSTEDSPYHETPLNSGDCTRGKDLYMRSSVKSLSHSTGIA